MNKIFLILVLLLFNLNFAFSQSLSGIIVDKVTNEKLAFVNIQFNKQKQGTTTNIDGKFYISDISKIEFLKISYIGYIDTIINKQDFINKKIIYIKLQKKSIELNEIKILPTENPAHRIINLAIKNKDLNNPLKLKSFNYTSYNKMIFTGDVKKLDSLPEDSFYINTKKFFDYQHLMITESVSKRKFKNPDYNNETVIASRVSGLKNPAFTLLATQLQSFSFYNDIFKLYNKRYLSPLSKNSTKKYFFLLQDTIFNERGDTSFVISFRPRKGKIFNSMEGILYINSNKYAIENVIAQPSETNTLSFKIQQKYETINDTTWFPKQLNTNIIFNNLSLGSGKNKTKIVGIGKTYLYDINIDSTYKKHDFSNIELDVDKNNIAKTKQILKKYRVDSLTVKDKRTYRVIDSLGQAEHLDRKTQIMEALLSGYIPIGFVSIDLNSIIDENLYEGFKLGIGLKTNDKVSKYFSLFGGVSYGFKNKKINYRTGIDITPFKNKEQKLQVSYIDDVFEKGGYEFYEKTNFSSSEVYREYMIREMFNQKIYQISLNSTIFKYLKTNIYINRINFLDDDFNSINFCNNCYCASFPNIKSFQLYTYGIKLRYAYKEKFIKSNNTLISTGTKFPVIYFNYRLFSDNMMFSKKFERYEIKIAKKIYWKKIGNTNLSFVGGYLDGNPNPNFMYSGNGSRGFGKFSIFAENTFSTKFVEFSFVNKFIALYFEHDFGNRLIKTKHFKPEFAISNNIGYGFNTYKGLENFSYNKGIYEAGFQINNIINQMNIIKYGIGIFYDYSENNDNINIMNNFAYKLTVKFNIE